MAGFEGEAAGRQENSRRHLVLLKDVGIYVAVFLAIALPFALAGLGPALYNRYFSVVGRTHSQVLRMDSCTSAEALLQQVGERYPNRPNLSSQAHRPARRDIYGKPVSGLAYLSLYDWVLLDDVQLGVLCESGDRIARIDFIAD